MSLFPNEDILTREIESWRSFAASLNSKEYKQLFNTNSLLMSLLLSQQKMIDWLSAQVYDNQLRHEAIKVEL